MLFLLENKYFTVYCLLFNDNAMGSAGENTKMQLETLPEGLNIFADAVRKHWVSCGRCSGQQKLNISGYPTPPSPSPLPSPMYIMWKWRH
jgi:hypothetical protein